MILRGLAGSFLVANLSTAQVLTACSVEPRRRDERAYTLSAHTTSTTSHTLSGIYALDSL